MQKIQQYLRELDLCRRMSADIDSRVRLMVATCRFHLANRNRLSRPRVPDLPHRYRLTIGKDVFQIWLRTFSGDLFVFHEIFLGKCYHIPHPWQHNIQVVVDLGANIGLSTLFYESLFSGVHYTCVEPDNQNVVLLKQNLAALNDRATIISGAVSVHSGYETFHSSPWSWGGYLNKQENEGCRVQCYTMEEILAMSHIHTNVDLLKVDIEGAECDIFSKNNNWLSRVRMIITELHHPCTIEKFQADILDYGFTVISPDTGYGNRLVFAHK